MENYERIYRYILNLENNIKYTPSEYGQRIYNLNRSYRLALDEVIESYRDFMVYPENASYQETFQVDEETFNNLKSDIFLLKNQLSSDLNIMNRLNNIYNYLINRFNQENKNLTKKLNTLENQNNAATGELDLITEKYYITAFKNGFLLFLSIFLTIISAYKIKNNIKT